MRARLRHAATLVARHYLAPCLLVGLAALATMALSPVLHQPTFGLLFLAVAVSAALGGLTGGLVATAVAIAARDLALPPPIAASADYIVHLAVLVLTALAIGWLTRRETRGAQRFGTTLANIADAVLVTDGHGRVTFMNSVAEQLTGWTVREAAGQEVVDVMRLVNEQTREPVDNAAMRPLRERFDAVVSPTLLLARDGTARPIEYSGAPIHDGWGRVTSGVLVFRDVTTRRAAETERQALLRREREARTAAEAANRLKDEFLMTLSHELRSPLNAILGWCHMASQPGLDPQTRERALPTIGRNARALTRLIDDLLDVSRITSGKLRLDVQRVDPRTVVEAAVEAMRPAAQAKAIRLQTHLDPNVLAVSGDAERLQQVVWNLVANAIKFTPREGTVDVRLASVDSEVEITVNDTGEGIDPRFLPHVFDQFRQADGTVTRSHGGLGLGLAISRHIVELHGGTVAAQSAGRGLGSSFVVRLPALSGAGAPSEAHEARGLAPVSGTKRLDGLRVLVVDDEADAREIARVMLESAGAQVRTASAATEALTLRADWQPDVLLCDIAMPADDGYALMRRLRVLEATRSLQPIPAVAVTAYARGEDRARALAAGFHSYLPKPIEAAEMIAIVAALGGVHRPA